MSSSDVSATAKDHVGTKLILVRIIRASGDAVRDAIIRATNSQTAIPKPFLRGMDGIHRNIEDFLRPHGLFYERRKNHYKNQGIKRSLIVTLPEMAQALVATLLFRGGDARGRPTSLLQNDGDYAQLFNESYSLEVYLNIIRTKQRVMTALISLYGELGSAFRNDVIWHVLAYISASRFRTPGHANTQWGKLNLTDAEIATDVTTVVAYFQGKNGDDKLAKSPLFQTVIYTMAAAKLTGQAFDEDNLKQIPAA